MCDVRTACRSVRVQVYFAHTIVQYRKVARFIVKVSCKVNLSFSGSLPNDGGNFIEFGLWDTTIHRGQVICLCVACGPKS